MSDAPLYPSEDGPGAGVVVEVAVRVMVGLDRSTVLIRRGRDTAVVHEVREHGREADGLGAAVEAAVREGLAAAQGPSPATAVPPASSRPQIFGSGVPSINPD